LKCTTTSVEEQFFGKSFKWFGNGSDVPHPSLLTMKSIMITWRNADTKMTFLFHLIFEIDS
jgi:hypothetical protein